MTMMTMLLEILAKATKLDIPYKTFPDGDGGYYIQFEIGWDYPNRGQYELVRFPKGGHNHDMGELPDMLHYIETERTRKQRRAEILSKLTQEECEILGI